MLSGLTEGFGQAKWRELVEIQLKPPGLQKRMAQTKSQRCLQNPDPEGPKKISRIIGGGLSRKQVLGVLGVAT